MTITLRSTKGVALTYSELDGNFTDLSTRVNAKLNSSSVSTFGLSLINDTSAEDARSTLGIDISKLVNNGNEMVLNSDGSVSIPSIIKLGDSKLSLNENGVGSVYLTSTADDTSALLISDSNVELYAAQDVIITANTASASVGWSFGAGGTTTFPNNTILGEAGQSVSIRTYDANPYTISSQNSNSWEAFAEDELTGANHAWAWIKTELTTVDTPNFIIENRKAVDGISYRWTFDENGNLDFPGQAAQPYRMRPSQYGYYTDTAPVVIFTGTSAAEVTKATIHVKGQETVGTVTSMYHQICEMMIVIKSVYDSSIPSTITTAEAIVYGVTHSSATPMATFDVQWNNTLSVVEITMVRDAAYTGVNAKVIATESVNLD